MTRRKNIPAKRFIQAWQAVGHRAADKEVRLSEVVSELGYDISEAGVRARYMGYVQKADDAGVELKLYPMHTKGRGARPLDLGELNALAAACIPQDKGDDSIPAGGDE